MADASRTTQGLVDQWLKAQDRVKSLRSQLDSAERGLADSAQALGLHLAPEDAVQGDRFNIWVRDHRIDRDRLIEVVVRIPKHNFIVDWRQGTERLVAEPETTNQKP